MELNKITKDLKALSKDETIEIQAGESLWYWIAYGAGMTGRGYMAFLDGFAWSSQNMPGLK